MIAKLRKNCPYCGTGISLSGDQLHAAAGWVLAQCPACPGQTLVKTEEFGVALPKPALKLKPPEPPVFSASQTLELVAVPVPVKVPETFVAEPVRAPEVSPEVVRDPPRYQRVLDFIGERWPSIGAAGVILLCASTGWHHFQGHNENAAVITPPADEILAARQAATLRAEQADRVEARAAAPTRAGNSTAPGAVTPMRAGTAEVR